MKRWFALVLAAALALWQLPSQAQPRVFSQGELDALLAPVALYPDPVLSNILVAATYPDDLRDAAAWSRANPQLTGEDAVRAAEPIPWHPSVKALLAFPELLVRMDESPQWTADLGAAFLEQEPYVMDTVQGLRRRAQASGSLQSNDQYSVQQQGSSIAVYPAQPQAVYVPYYDPYVVYGQWWWPAYRPVFWRPWYAHPTVFVSSSVFFVRSVDWHRRHVVRHVAHHPPPAKHHRAIANHYPAPVNQHRAPARHGDSGQHWREQRRQDVRAPRVHQPAAPVTIQNQPPRALRPIVDAARMQTQPQARPQPQARQIRPMVESIRNPALAAAHGHAQPHPARQPQPQVQQRREHRQEGRNQGRQANHHPQRRG